MDIDLFLSPKGDYGLLCSMAFDEMPAGVIFDAETMEITIEFVENDPLHCNITVEFELQERLLFSNRIFIGMLEDGKIQETLQLPFFHLNDPYKDDMVNPANLGKAVRFIRGFEKFMQGCDYAQPLHRNDLSIEDNGSVLRGLDPHHLELVPQLVRARMLEGPSVPQGPSGPSGVTYEASPSMMPAPKGPGGATMGGGQRRVIRPQQPPQKENDDD